MSETPGAIPLVLQCIGAVVVLKWAVEKGCTVAFGALLAIMEIQANDILKRRGL